ncbi:MAG: hypothetical protein ACI3XQ_00970, partial [Eubacteriales bacterium]
PADTWTSDLSYCDLSWCKTLESETSGKTVTVDGKYYYIMGDWTKQEYHITTAAQLAGLAYLSNLTSGDLFKGDIFYIDADIDLGAHLWMPISTKSKFRGSIIGNVDGGSATISNMIIDTSEESNVSVGLVGQFGGDWIENLDLKGAKITAHSYTVGSFVGWQNGNVGSGLVNGVRAGGYRNLSSDAEIVVTSYRDDRFDDIGGIVGIINGTTTDNETPAPVITGCVFTGTISAPYGDNVGGILGIEQSDGNGVRISDCVVVSEKLEWGKSNYYITNNQEWNTGLGGIAGNIYSNKDTTIPAVAFSVTNCYAAANLITLECDVADKAAKNVGGIVGAACSQSKIIENCQFDGIVSGNAGSIGGVLGRYLSPVTIRNTVVSGVAMRSSGSLSAYVGTGKNDGLAVENCFNSIKMLTGTGGDGMAPITATTDLSSLLSLTDGSEANIWTKGASDLYPLLAVAVPYISASLSVSASGADFSWCDMSESMKISSVAQLDALAVMFDAVSPDARENFAKKVTSDLEITGDMLNGYSENARKYINIICGVDTDVDDSKICLEFAQITVEPNVSEKPQFNGTYNIRVIAKMSDEEFNGVSFDYSLNQDGEEKVSGESRIIKTCYRTIIEVVDGEEKAISADGGYFVAFTITNISFEDIQSTKLSVQAKAAKADGSLYKSSIRQFTLTLPAAD